MTLPFFCNIGAPHFFPHFLAKKKKRSDTGVSLKIAKHVVDVPSGLAAAAAAAATAAAAAISSFLLSFKSSRNINSLLSG